MSKTIYIHTDGACSGNPGPASIAAVLRTATTLSDGREMPDAVLAEIAEVLPGSVTSNEAEYRAVLRGLAEARTRGYDRVKLYSDSQLAVRQITGAWACRETRLGRLCAEVLEARGAFEHFEIVWIPREKNRRADRLATEALEAHLGRDERQDEFTFHNFQRLQHDLKQLQHDFQRLQDENRQLQDENRRLQDENRRLQDENQDLRQELEHLKKEQVERTESTALVGSAA